MSTEKEKKDLPKRKSSFLRHPFFIVIFLFIIIPFAALAFLIRGGVLVNDAFSGAAEKYFSRFAHLSVNFKNLSGNAFDGYTLEELSLGDKTTPDIVVAKKIFIDVAARESWAQQKIILRGSLDGVRVKEDKINELLHAIEEEFQLLDDTEVFTPLAFVVPKNFSGSDWAGDLGWKIAKISFNREGSEKLLYKFSLDGEYSDERFQLDGTTELSEEALPLCAELRFRDRLSDVTAHASLEDGRVALKNMEGRVLNSPMNGSATIDFAQEDPEISADFSFRSIDLSPLRQFVPDLGATTVQNLNAHLSGSLGNPVCEFSLKGGNVEWQEYKLSDVEARGILNEEDLSVKFSGNTFGTIFEAGGNFGLSTDGLLNLEASIESLQLQELEKFFPDLESAELEGIASVKITASGTVDRPSARINVRSEKISLQNEYVFSDVDASIIATTSKLTLQNFSALAYGSKISASGSLGLEENSQSLALYGSVNQLDLGAFCDVVGKLDGAFSIGGTLARPQINVEAKINSLDYARFGAKDITLTARGGDVLDVQLVGFTKMNTPFGGGGKITLRGTRSAMDLKFNLDRLRLSELFPYTLRISGDVSMALLVGGTFENPDVSAIISSPEILAGRYKITDPQVNAVLNGQKIDIDASVALGDRRASVTGTLDFKNDLKKGGVNTVKDSASSFENGFKCVLDIIAPSVRIDFLIPSLAGKVYGRATVKSHAIFTEDSFEAAGDITSPMMGANGIHAANMSVPFTLKDKKLEIPDGNLTLGGGVLNLRADGDFESGSYSFSLRGKNIDLKKLAEPIDLPAQIEGEAEVSFGGRVTTGFTTLVRAGGRIRLRDISVDKFNRQTALVGNSPLKIENGNFIFKIDDDEVYLMPGSAISAPPDDKIFNFISFAGTVWKARHNPPNLAPELLPEDLFKYNDELYRIHVNGSINLRVLNGLFSGFGAVMDAGASGDMSTENIASSFVQRYITGRFGTQYRAFEVDISGNDYREMRVKDLKFESEGNFAEVDTTDWRKDSGQVKDYQRYSFNYGLPVGRDPLREEKKKARRKRAEDRKKREEAAETTSKEPSDSDGEN